MVTEIEFVMDRFRRGFARARRASGGAGGPTARSPMEERETMQALLKDLESKMTAAIESPVRSRVDRILSRHSYAWST